VKQIGLIGFGSIGLPIAVNMMGKGLEVHGYRRGAMTEFAQAGGKPAAAARFPNGLSWSSAPAHRSTESEFFRDLIHQSTGDKP